MNLIEYADADMLALNLAQTLAGALENMLFHEDRVTLVVPGGETPGPVFDNLCAADIDWSRVDVTLSDERCLPDVHLRSNARLIKKRLLVGRAGAARFHPLYVGSETPEDSLAEIESGLAPCLPISVLLLGMGSDMHTASLFAGSDGLLHALDPNAPILVPMRAEGAPEPRITFSARVLNEALNKHLVITGTPKRNALEKALHKTPEEAPVVAILNDCTIHWAP
ncbi:6-phosphogluconolactonase [Rhodobacteraceae bacterium LMO-12]|nr:6-phosphogluconolactonase [Rhodobacteraceae bacterium LMO-JJ12]